MKKNEKNNPGGIGQIKQKSKGKKMVKWIILAVVLVLIALGVNACRNATKQAMELLQNMTSTETVSTRSLIKSVGATGKIVSVSRKDVKTDFTSTIGVDEVYVEVGDMVQVGDRLVAFDTTDIEEDLADAQNALKRTQSSNGISLSDGKRSISDTERSRDYIIANAAAELADAQKAYQDVVDKYNDLDEDTDDAEDDRDDAEDIYNRLSAQLASARQEFAAAESVSGNDQGRYTAAKAACEELEAKTATAKQAYDDAEQIYQAKKKEFQDYKDSDIVKEKQDALTRQQRDYDNTVANQDSSLASAKSSYSQTQLGMDTTSQQRTIASYEKQMQEGVLTAPTAGMVTHIYVEEGENYSPAAGAVVTIQDISAFEIEAEIDQYDISDIAVGQQVLIKTDATGDEELQGTVIKVSPVATTAGASNSGSSVTYAVRISIDTPNDRLRLDMTASLSIIVTEHENALTVPYNAIQKDEAGNAFVEIPGAEGQKNEKKYVHILMESNYYTEIAPGDLEEGTEVIVIDSSNDYLQFFEEAGF